MNATRARSDFLPIGAEGQRRISAVARRSDRRGRPRAASSAELLVRAGVGFIRIIDRDFVEASNLQRQSLYDEDDVRRNLPKAEAAAAKLRRINSGVQIEAIVDDVNPSNVEDYIQDVDLVLDALDNFETRFVLNDACAKHSRAWIYAAAVGSYGLVMPIMPGKSPCLRCMLGSLPAPGTSPTCDTAGVIGPITHIVASMQVAEALKLICGARWNLRTSGSSPTTSGPTAFNVSSSERMPWHPARSVPKARFDYLNGTPLRTVTLCGRNAVQLIPAVKADLNFSETLKVDSAQGGVQFNEFLLKCSAPPYEVTVFQGRARDRARHGRSWPWRVPSIRN